MLEKMVKGDRILDSRPFVEDEVRFNLLHLICGGAGGAGGSLGLKRSDGSLIFARTPGHNAWLWVWHGLSPEEKRDAVRKLVEYTNDPSLPGVTGDPQTAEMFAGMFAARYNVSYKTYMMLEAYCCPEVKKPSSVPGTLQKASNQHIETVAGYFAGFSENAFGITVDPASQLPAAEAAVGKGGLYLWIVDGRPVSMANIAHRSSRHARINAVYTPPEFRKNGFASAVVAEICDIVLQEGLQPMLYADLANPDSNKVYRNIGFIEKGTIADLKFTSR